MIKDTSAQDVKLAPKRFKPLPIVIVISIIAIALITYLVSPTLNSWRQAGSSVSADRLRIATVTRGDLQRDLSVQGRVVAAVSPTVYSPYHGVVTLHVDAGDTVTVGQIIADIDSPELTNQLSQQLAQLQESKTELERAKISSKKSQLEYQKAVDIAQVALTAAEREKRRSDRAMESQSISEIDFEAAQDNLQNARLVYEHAVSDAALNAESLAFDIQTRQLQFDRQQLLVNNLQRQVSDLQISSPVNGIVGNLSAQQKDQVIRNQPILSVVDLSEFVLDVTIPESYADDLAIGMPAEVMVNGQAHSAQLITISPEIENNQVNARVSFNRTDDNENTVEAPQGLRQNQRLTTRILMQNQRDVLLVQRGQFLESGAGKIAYRLTQDSAERVSIQTGARSLAAVEILTGLSEGDRIIISSTDSFNGADRVLITP
ncbi:efflux RND transporter periplasmic adaptor subunit [Alteromonas oceanisediminis]|uniref:efflux RND transporter periplasmic adaptor subunit n=1 Tax=Alteromonas oceanisediminis TaxID=2836180 RepID=UPI001BDB59F9|nr:HlyD family efflux transporter periplasmic adaptor subunit [Alteromonas oceanisediminis]MBT0587153.1 efflux RND transporter periplasmic adaptor subunit [Alteromonas oceanisediminis]